jgi:hypothetical protein
VSLIGFVADFLTIWFLLIVRNTHLLLISCWKLLEFEVNFLFTPEIRGREEGLVKAHSFPPSVFILIFFFLIAVQIIKLKRNFDDKQITQPRFPFSLLYPGFRQRVGQHIRSFQVAFSAVSKKLGNDPRL